MKCRACEEVMNDMPVTFDVMSFMQPIKQMYCNNQDCEHFGFVTVAGIPEPKEEDPISSNER